MNATRCSRIRLVTALLLLAVCAACSGCRSTALAREEDRRRELCKGAKPIPVADVASRARIVDVNVSRKSVHQLLGFHVDHRRKALVPMLGETAPHTGEVFVFVRLSVTGLPAGTKLVGTWHDYALVQPGSEPRQGRVSGMVKVPSGRRVRAWSTLLKSEEPAIDGTATQYVLFAAPADKLSQMRVRIGPEFSLPLGPALPDL